MAKPGRNDPCPCGSGNKYKKCCLAKEEAVAREQLVKAQAPRDTLRRDQRAAADRLQVTELTAAVAARLARAEEEDAYEDALDIASNAVVDLVRAAKLDEAEAAARDLLRRFPDVHDGWDRLGMVHEARGDSRQAAEKSCSYTASSTMTIALCANLSSKVGMPSGRREPSAFGMYVLRTTAEEKARIVAESFEA